MNYYSHHIGDYTTATAHLSILEDGAYRRLMDRYYTTEAPLPADEAALFRVIRARAEDEKEAIRQVLVEFFQLTGAGWTHKRCDTEIAAFKDKSGKAADAANKRWNKPTSTPAMPGQDRVEHSPDASAMPTQCERNADAMPTNNQEPRTNNQEPERARSPASPAVPASPKKPRKPTKVSLPDGFSISDEVKAWAAKSGHSNLQAHFDSFVGKARANGYAYADWDHALQNAIRDDWAKLGQQQTRSSGPPRQSRHSGFENIDYSEGIEDGRIT